LQDFPGLAHRCEWVGEWRGVTWINDSKGTNVGATVAALQGLRGPLVLIAGGVGKDADFGPLAAAARGRVKAAVLLGRDAPLLAGVLAPICPVSQVGTMADAVTAARELAGAGDTVLLSPACASLDMYADFAARGDDFRARVREAVS
jgi:UDP-N-acetylmuramoylalanine--D-glutamate ligase